MRITLVHPAFRALGGAEVLVASHARFLREAGRRVRLLTLDYDDARWASLLPGVEIVAKRQNRSLLVRTEARAPGRDLRDGWWLQRAIERDDSDLIVAYNYPSNVHLGMAKTRARTVWHCNEPPRHIYYDTVQPVMSRRARAAEPPYLEISTQFYHRHRRRVTRTPFVRAGYRWLEWQDQRAVRATPCLWALSHYAASMVEAVYGRRDVEVVYPLVRFADNPPHRAGLRRDQLRVLVHTRLENAKNVDTVLRAAAVLRREGRVPFHIDVTGEGAFRPDLERIATELRLDAQVTFRGWLSSEQLEAVYAQVDVLAFVPLDEPFGMVFPEAASRGLLMVGPDHGGPREILEEGRIGRMVDALSPEALADALTAVWQSSDADVDRQRERADRSCRARFGREAIGSRLLELVRSA